MQRHGENTVNKTILSAIAATAMLVGTTGAQATSMTVDFDLRGSGPEVAELNLSQGGLDLNITPDTISNTNDLNGEQDIFLTQGQNGLGVDNRNCFLFFCDSNQLDGFGSNDIALFSFSKDVTIESFTLLDSDSNDDLSLFGGPSFSFLGEFRIPGSNVIDFAGLSSALLTGDVFGIAAIGGNDNFRIAGVSVSYDAVPVPAALPLMLTGLVGLGLFGRRAKRRQIEVAA